MLSLPSRPALKALRNPFRSPFPNPLRRPLQTRHLHHEPAAFSGPPSYATLVRRFSASNPNPIRFFTQKAANEAIKLNDYDVLSTESHDDTLHSEISELVGIPYLKEATKGEADNVAEKIHGILYGQKRRMILPCVLSVEDKARWIFFTVHSGSPLTYITAEVAQAFGLNEHEDPWSAKIAGYPNPVHMSPSDSLFSNVNLLGQDFCYKNELGWDWGNDRTLTYYIGTGRRFYRKK